MAAEPKKKISRVRGRTRRAHISVPLPKLSKCSNCGHLKPPHIACPECGFYGSKKIITTKTDKRIAQKLKTDAKAQKESAPKKEKPTNEKAAKPKTDTTKKSDSNPPASEADSDKDNKK